MTQTSDAAPRCPYCGGLPHTGKCPLVSAIEYHPDGTVKRVEFHAPAVNPATFGQLVIHTYRHQPPEFTGPWAGDPAYRQRGGSWMQ